MTTSADDAVRHLGGTEAALNKIEMTAIGPLPVWLSLAEVSNLTGRSIPAIKKAINSGQFVPAYEILGQPRIRAAEYAAWATNAQPMKKV